MPAHIYHQVSANTDLVIIILLSILKHGTVKGIPVMQWPMEKLNEFAFRRLVQEKHYTLN
jgi:hypothetical protein